MLQIILHYDVILHLLYLCLLPKAKLQTGTNYHRKAILVLLVLTNMCSSGFFVCSGFFCLVVFFPWLVFCCCWGFFKIVITCSRRKIANLNSKKCGRGEQNLYLCLGLCLRNHAIKSPPPLCQ